MKIILVRHGETDYNKNRKIQGSINIPLNETGRQQAKNAAQQLKNISIDSVYSSTLDRAIETAKILVTHSENTLEVQQDKRLVERSYGIFEGISFQSYDAMDEVERESNLEEASVVADRITNFLNEKYESHQTILVVAHGACIRLFLESKRLIPTRKEIYSDLSRYEKYRYINNTAFITIEYDGESFKLISFGE